MISQTESAYPPADGSEFLVLEPIVAGGLRLTIEYWGPKQSDWDRLVEAKDLLGQFDGLLRELGWNYHPISE
jgi:hypothetical protein